MKKLFRIFLILAGIVALLFLFTPTYITRALIYQKVGIDDYPIFNNREIKIGKSEDWQINKSNKRNYSEALRKKIEELEPIAFLVIQNKKIIHEEYWRNTTDSTLTNSFSAAKSIIGLLIGFAHEDGYIRSLDQPVSDFFPEYKTSTNKNLTIRQVLTMSSGLNWDESYGSLFNKTTEAYYGTNLRKLISNLEVIEEPGVTFKYLSGNTQLLAFIVSAATHKSVSEYATEKLWIPLGAKHTALWSLDKKDGMEKAYCCFNSNARDFARIGQLVLDSGKWNGQQLISQEYILESINPSLKLKDKEGGVVDYYGYHWWVMHYKGMVIPYARGILGQYIFVIPAKNAVVVRLGLKRADTYENHAPIDAYYYIDAALEVLN